ncbi:ATP-binding protein [Sphingomonas alpina]|uniref:ATP-binding protein n=1 Tax=Sphingomonas alpina TaxID=653931 RepID=A0A7H0LES9_9SPHN|nr:ATP-binding protein [Sphingomonas alpina]QNQ08182.1 ATP-binding protein [Sphingomonas alpina]
MAKLYANLVKRVQRLPKPARTSDALQPTFEAISNAIHAIYTRWEERASAKGLVEVFVGMDRDKSKIWITVEDNGIGLDDENFEAFLTTDTDHKITFGGKGVGRLLWLDCFGRIEIRSRYTVGDLKKERQFRFRLNNEEQIVDLTEGDQPSNIQPGTRIKFSEIRDNGYLEKFPSRSAYIFQHIFSHFLPVFVGGKSPTIEVNCGDESRTYPRDMAEHISRQIEIKDLAFGELGLFRMTLLECHKSASASLGGNHFIHFIANDRTVVSQCIDGRLGIGYFGDAADRVFHACLFSSYLDKHVNQERTGFTFDDHLLDSIVNEVCIPHVEHFLAEPLEEQSVKQRKQIAGIVETYPSVGFGTVEELQKYIPTGEGKPDAIYSHLARQRFRRDYKQAESIRSTFKTLKGGEVNSEGFYAAVAQAVNDLEQAETKSLAEYVVRRKAVLEFLEVLLQKVRIAETDSSYQTESVLHNLICPMRIRTVGDELKIMPASSHELWVIDERLTFAEYFSSDRPFRELGSAFESEERADVLIFNTVHSLRQADEMARVLLVEFKRPGRKSYNNDENPQQQVERYVRLLQNGGELDVKGRPIKLNGSTVFNCFIIADIVGKMDEWTYSWERIAGTGGRRYIPRDGFSGSIELIGWDDLLKDATDRNKAFFDRAGISGRSFFSPD